MSGFIEPLQLRATHPGRRYVGCVGCFGDFLWGGRNPGNLGFWGPGREAAICDPIWQGRNQPEVRTIQLSDPSVLHSALLL
jgi:hypothetical protein